MTKRQKERQEVWRTISEKRTGKQLAPIPPQGYEAGKTYYNGYWQQFHTVEAVRPDSFNKYTSRWEDGETTTHCTEPDPEKDFMLVR